MHATAHAQLRQRKATPDTSRQGCPRGKPHRYLERPRVPCLFSSWHKIQPVSGRHFQGIVAEDTLREPAGLISGERGNCLTIGVGNSKRGNGRQPITASTGREARGRIPHPGDANSMYLDSWPALSPHTLQTSSQRGNSDLCIAARTAEDLLAPSGQIYCHKGLMWQGALRVNSPPPRKPERSTNIYRVDSSCTF